MTRHENPSMFTIWWRAGDSHTGLFNLMEDGQYLGTQRWRSRSHASGPIFAIVIAIQVQTQPPTVSHRHASRQKFRSSSLCGNVTTEPI